ncbi:MAG: hypothetical protein K2L46_01420 [Paramuribaculum sp.]|nr:hypothetical protein [Paramuribaculum sp.]MDE6487918.1 hypothetical protein [Paramuribaculum sp.]
MIETSMPVRERPQQFKSSLHEKIYAGLDQLGIDFERVSCEKAVTIDQCRAIATVLRAPVVKTLFVANRQLTRFHLVVLPGSKPFVTKDFSKSRGVSRVSFVSPELMMSMLSTPVGGASPLSILADEAGIVELDVDAEVMGLPEVVCPAATPCDYVRLKTSDLFNRLLPSLSGRHPVVVSL